MGLRYWRRLVELEHNQAVSINNYWRRAEMVQHLVSAVRQGILNLVSSPLI